MNQIQDVKYVSCSGVYEPAEDTALLMRTCSCRGDVLEIGTGSGVIAIHCALNGARVTASDFSRDALTCAELNMTLNEVSITFIESDLFSNIPGMYDEIIFNPPYLPTNDEIYGSEQWNGGADGFSTTRPFLANAVKFLKKGGVIRIILSDLTDFRVLKSEFSSLNFEENDHESFDFETIYAFTITRKEE